MAYRSAYSTKVTPQSQPIPGSAQEQNNAGGYSYVLDDWKRLQRFLILGAEGSTYYVGRDKLQRDNAEAVVRCIKEDGSRVVNEIIAISVSGRAPKNGPALFALALCAGLGSAPTKMYALAALPSVARTGTHLFEFCEYVQGVRGWGRGLRGAITNWYSQKSPAQLAYQAVKYQQRNGWAHRDLFRLAHPMTTDESRAIIYNWIVKGWPDVGIEPHPDPAARLIWACERAKRATTAREVVQLITDYNLPREAIPSEWLKDRHVWAVLLDEMPMTAMIRNLGTMSKLGLLVPGSSAEVHVVRALEEVERLVKARIHPIALLSALRVYAQGHGVKSDATWEPTTKVIDALDAAFYRAFQTIEPTGKRFLLALDVSGSMKQGEIAGVPGLTPRDASAALALVTMATEPNCEVVGFMSEGRGWSRGAALMPLAISPKQRINDAVKVVSGLNFGGTDCALPMIWAQKQKKAFDGLVVLTDNETWAGEIHPSQALRAYRQAVSPEAKLVVVGMTATQFTIADPTDAGSLDVVGFDAATPSIISDFVGGR